MSAPATCLVADIGGTNARFAIAEGDEARGYRLEHIRRLKNEDFETLRDAALAYLDSYTGAAPRRACFAVAAPITGDEIQFTNAAWSFSKRDLAGRLHLDALETVNDFAALARGAPLIACEHLRAIKPGARDPAAPIAVLGPGTGLGLGLVIPTSQSARVIPTQGGHAAFAPQDEDERAVWAFIEAEYGYVSWELVLSGCGLVNIHRALCQAAGRPCRSLRPEEITAAALDASSPTCAKTLAVFCAALGTFAGNAALMGGARGGVFLGGGIVQSLGETLCAGPFRQRFQERGPMSEYLEAIPVDLILTDEAALIGAAALAAGA